MRVQPASQMPDSLYPESPVLCTIPLCGYRAWQPTVTINTQDAGERNIKNADRVIVSTVREQRPLRAMVIGGILQGL